MSYNNNSKNRDIEEDDDDDEEIEQEKLREKQDEFRRQCKFCFYLFNWQNLGIKWLEFQLF
jgi:hypothetical protein